ncbi:dihydropteroate synthase [Deltaproteobacteria bacterium IMCC39524]|nr:dihydropteroate synthase [Deltaproteobacteria bacterium IMCC39524]
MIKGLVAHHGTPQTYLAGRTLRLDLQAPCIVGVLNVAPDSFSDGGLFCSVNEALEQARSMAREGAALIDIGGESTRPGAPSVDEAEELDRVLPVIEALTRELDLPLSIDTSKSTVAAAAVASGVEFVNDISGLSYDPKMADVVAASGAGLIVMHTRGKPETMQQNTDYEDLVAEVVASLQKSIRCAEQAGVALDKIAIDPGIGFGKDTAGNLELLRQTATLAELGRPILLGTSRKSFIGQVLEQKVPSDRLIGTMATLALGYAGGARIFRVHDVAAARQTVLMAQAVCDGAEWAASKTSLL